MSVYIEAVNLGPIELMTLAIMLASTPSPRTKVPEAFSRLMEKARIGKSFTTLLIALTHLWVQCINRCQHLRGAVSNYLSYDRYVCT